MRLRAMARASSVIQPSMQYSPLTWCIGDRKIGCTKRGQCQQNDGRSGDEAGRVGTRVTGIAQVEDRVRVLCIGDGDSAGSSFF